MASSEREHRLRFLGLTERDEQLLREFRPVLELHVAAVEDAFYAHLLNFPETAQLLNDHTTVARLKKLQRDYLMRLFEGNFDQAYFDDRLRVGKTHERVGLSPRWYLMAFNLYFKLITPLIRDHCLATPGHAHETIVALEKAFMLDASLAMDAYIESDRYRHLQQLESIINDSADVIFSLDNDGRFRSWNRAAESVFGWRAEEVLGKPIKLLVPADQFEAGELARIESEIHRDGHSHLETVRVAKDGRLVPVEVSVSLLHDPQGNPIGRSAILRDITERRRLEEEKLRAERLAVIGTMSAKLAHEIRNPLSSITLNIDLVRDEVETLTKDNPAAGTESRALLQSLAVEVLRIQRVTEDYLKFARLPKPMPDRVQLNEILDQGLAFLDSLFTATNVTVTKELDPDLPVLHADEGQLWQAILNLVRNAIEAMPRGGTLAVRTERRDDRVVLTIRDTGKGMTPPECAQVFTPFFSTKVGGTGLGLPLTQQIINEHCGQIRCESAPEQGTTFVIELPTRHGQTS
ncbi:MAG: protoglobin domain-containing protein [Verrucomicrobiota bacterium]